MSERCKDCEYLLKASDYCLDCVKNPNFVDNFIKAEPKVLTAEESMEKNYVANKIYCVEWKKGYFDGFDDGKDQGRLERDLELRELREAAEYASETITSEMTGIRKINTALENLKPLKP